MGTQFSSLPPDREAAELVAVMAAVGVDRGVVFYCGADYRHGNQVTLEAAAMAPERLITYAYLNNDAPQAMLEDLERCRQAEDGWS